MAATLKEMRETGEGVRKKGEGREEGREGGSKGKTDEGKTVTLREMRECGGREQVRGGGVQVGWGGMEERGRGGYKKICGNTSLTARPRMPRPLHTGTVWLSHITRTR